MIPEISLSSLLLVVGMAQSLFFAMLLLRYRTEIEHPNHKRANELLAAFLLLFAFILLEQFIDSSGYYFYLPHLIYVITPLAMLIGFTVYGFVDAETSDSPYRYSWGQLWHAVPCLLYYIALIPIFWQSTETKRELVYLSSGLSFEPEAMWQTAFLHMTAFYVEQPVELASVFIYLVLSYRLLYRRVSKSSRPPQTADTRLTPSDQIWLLSGLALVVILLIIDQLFLEPSEFTQYTYVNLVLSIQVLVIFVGGYKGFHLWQQAQQARYTAVLSQTKVEKTAVSKEKKDKYEKSGLSEESAERIYQTLCDLMGQQHVYRDSDLSLPVLAERIGTSTNHLSQVINMRFQQSFFDYVNIHRVEDAKKRLEDPANQDLVLTIALDAGFNSKTPFYTAFKKHVGMTPSQYKKSVTAPRP